MSTATRMQGPADVGAPAAAAHRPGRQRDVDLAREILLRDTVGELAETRLDAECEEAIRAGIVDALDLEFAPGFTVLTGETGAGKSILLDAFALALGARGDQALVRQGVEQGQVIALVSDAGMPAISDPGSVVVRAFIEAGLPVDCIPGPSALVVALLPARTDTIWWHADVMAAQEIRLIRGRSMKSSGRISFQRSTTCFDLEKNRCPPISKR